MRALMLVALQGVQLGQCVKADRRCTGKCL